MSLENIKSICTNVFTSCSDSTINVFIQNLDKIKDFVSNSDGTYLEKLNFLRDCNLFHAFNEILQCPINSDHQQKILSFFDFLIETCSDKTEVLVLFDSRIAKNIISYPFELSSIDVLQSYVTILKGISMKIGIIPASYIYSQEHPRCPLFDHAIAYIVHSDSTTIAAARLVVLNLFLTKDPTLCDIMSQPVAKHQIEHLISVIDTDGFAFLVDLMNVVPLELVNFIIEKLRKELMTRDAVFLARAATFLAESRARSMLMEVISERIGTFDITDKVTLGLLLFSLEKRLILADTAIKLGLLRNASYPTVTRFSKNIPKQPTKGKVYQELAYVLSHRSSIIVVALALRLFGMLSSGPPNIVHSVKVSIIKELKENLTTEVAELLNSSSIHRQRTDIEYILSEKSNQKRSKQYTLIAQLAEIESALARWNKTRFSWFKLAQNTDLARTTFGTHDGSNITITDNELVVSPTVKYKLWELSIIPNENKIHKVVTLYVPQKSRRSSLMLSTKDKISFEFLSFSVAMLFEGEIKAKQIELCRATLDNMVNNK